MNPERVSTITQCPCGVLGILSESYLTSMSKKRNISVSVAFGCDLLLTLSPPIPLKLYTLPYWSNPPFLIFDIGALWRSGLNARAPECQKLKMVG